MTETAVVRVVPMVDYLVVGDDPHLVANACDGCGALYFDRRNGCARCSGRAFSKQVLGTRGTVVSFTVVHRAAPGVPAPFTSAVVALDGGGVVKANIVDPDGSPRVGVDCGTEVELVTYAVATDREGTEAVGFGFTPGGAGVGA